MYTNVGGKLKTLAKIIFWVGTLLTVILAVNLIGAGIEESILYVFLVVIPLISWLSSLGLYAFGEAVECLSVIKTEVSTLKNEVVHLRRITSDLSEQINGNSGEIE